VEDNARQRQELNLVTLPVMERDSLINPIGAKLTFKGIPALRVKEVTLVVVGREKLFID
jgi:hypothetical protein